MQNIDEITTTLKRNIYKRDNQINRLEQENLRLRAKTQVMEGLLAHKKHQRFILRTVLSFIR